MALTWKPKNGKLNLLDSHPDSSWSRTYCLILFRARGLDRNYLVEAFVMGMTPIRDDIFRLEASKDKCEQDDRDRREEIS